MIEARGTVIALDGDRALVRLAEEGCGRCHEPGGCGGVHVARAFCPSPSLYRVRNPKGAKVGEEIAVVIHERALFRGALAGYGFPLAAVFLGAALGAVLGGEPGSMLGAAGGLAVSWGFQQTRWARNILPGPDSEPRIR